MSTMSRRILLIGLPLAVFLAVGFFDANRRATQLQDSAHAMLPTCEAIEAQAGEGSEAYSRCMDEFRAALEASSANGLAGALPLALGSAALVLVLLLLALRRRSGTPEA